MNAPAPDKNPGEGVPKETPGRNSLHIIDDIACDIFPTSDIAGELIQANYFDLSLTKQFDLAVDTVFAMSDDPQERTAFLSALKDSYSDRMRGYASGMVYRLYGHDPERCCKELYITGTLPGTWAQESGQKYLKWLMRDYGVEPILNYTRDWIEDSDEAARRLLVEALRPLGVWTGHLRELKQDPTVLESIIATLLNDTSRYVQLAVGNCLNDISKDNPDTLCEWVKSWRTQGIAQSPEALFIIERGMRTLLRQSNAKALVLMGYAPIRALRVTWESKKLDQTHSIRIGRQLPTSLRIENLRKQDAKIRAQLLVEGPGAGNKPRRFTYLIHNKVISGKSEISIARKILFKHKNSQPKLPGNYRITLIVNGSSIEVRNYAYYFVE